MKEKHNPRRKYCLISGLAIIFSLWIIIGNGAKVQAETITVPTPIKQIFPDDAFAETIKDNLKKKSVTDLVTQSELNSIDQIIANNSDIKSIQGIQYLPNVTKLFLNGNKLTDIKPLANLKNLGWLFLDENKIKDLCSLKDLKKLKSLSLEHNGISDINGLVHLLQLESLYLGNNKLTDITILSRLTKLDTLSLEDNEISDIVPLSGLTKLQNLYLSKNHISDLRALAGLKNLDVLELFSQECLNKSINHQTNLVVPNTVKNIDGSLVTPEIISDDGDYEKPNVKWHLPEFINEVSFIFYQPVTVGKAKARFHGRVTQPLKEVYTVSYDVDGTVIKTKVEAGTRITAPKPPTKQGYVKYIRGNAGIYKLPREDNSLKQGTLASHRCKALTVDREARNGGKLWYRLKNIGWTKAENLSLDRYDKIEYDKGVTAYARVKNALGNAVWTKPYNTAGAKHVNKLSVYQGKNMRILREAKTPITTWYQFSIGGKVIGWVDTRALNTFYKQSMEKPTRLTRYVSASKGNEAYYKVPVADNPVKRGTLAKYKNQKLIVDCQATVEGQLWYRIRTSSTFIGWTKAANLRAQK
ncbi:GW domain-containing glycosaminoglycan-binding protein [Listeria monocytogenes]|nr:GW domain-containing glycosaminoglycan-binding protein [Listeria monocytogenes]EAG6678863.1 GW domain-containing glycosaminoglycan-binding protein [Listeria monocytogenes]OEP83849.1 internalin [Listeria monocytogenes]PMR08653.1 GW domain-containing glycosaminoglycan-binding protein [Listeria monocytogenes]